MDKDINVVQLFGLSRIKEVEDVINNNLMQDWFVSIEYSTKLESVNSVWHKWGETKYGLSDSDELIKQIFACRVNYDSHAIRLNAQKSSPKTRFLYWVYCPENENIENKNTRIYLKKI